MTNTDLLTLLTDLRNQPREQQWLEFKVNAVTNEQIGAYISALSNGATLANQSFGYLILGVEDKNHAIKGTHFSFTKAKQGSQDLELWLRNLLQPKINFEIFEFNADKKHIGRFFEGNPEEYSTGEKRPERYRNPWLAHAMVNLGMIDRLGYGIHTMFLSQRNRFFPLPDYILTDPQKVLLQVYGQAIDENYSQVLMQRMDLSLSQVLLLDRVQKKMEITDDAAMALKKEKLIEGRKPNYFIGIKIAQETGQKAVYSKNKAFDKAYYLDLILKAIREHKSLNRKDIDELLWGKLPDWMSEAQKANRIKNLIHELRTDGKIINQGSRKSPLWILGEN
jgi:ATP-dependent DNA helicase RecG